MGLRRVLAMVVAAAVLLAALHVVLAHDPTIADSQIALSADGAGGPSPVDAGGDQDAGHCCFCLVLAHALQPEPLASGAVFQRAALTSAPFPLPRPVIPGIRRRPPRVS